MAETLLFLDFETSGLDPKRHAILQAAWIVDKDGTAVSEHVYDIKPEPDADLCLAALRVNDFSLERASRGIASVLFLTKLKNSLSPLGQDKVKVVGHCVEFDLSFLLELDRRQRGYIDTYISRRSNLDTAAIARFAVYLDLIHVSDYKLASLCKSFEIKHEDAHDALSDIRATRELFYALKKLFTER